MQSTTATAKIIKALSIQEQLQVSEVPRVKEFYYLGAQLTSFLLLPFKMLKMQENAKNAK